MKLRLGLALFFMVMLSLSIRGLPGNVTAEQLQTDAWVKDGPFELSPERGRFALTYSLAENGSFHFSVPIAKFAVPDLGYINGNYVSLFAPLVSFAALPGYWIGALVGISQVGTFAVVAVFALLNALLVQMISTKLGAHRIAGALAAIAFLFATPAYAYAVTLYQHHLTTFLILFSIYLLLLSSSVLTLAIVFLLCAVAVPLDYPNLIFLFPVGVAAAGRILRLTKTADRLQVELKPMKTMSLAAMAVPLLFFMWFNQMSYGNPWQLSGTVPGVKEIDALGKPALPSTYRPEDAQYYLNPELQKKSAVGFFHTHNLLNGMYIHLVSPDRGMIFYAPILIFGVVGLVVAYQRKMTIVPLTVGIIGANLLLYSMWGDPWGGWAFGSRYLVPTYALVSIFIGIALTRFRRNRFMLPLFLAVLLYSVAVNTLGAITSNANPPQVEVLAMEKVSGKEEKYTFERNWDYLVSNKSKSFVYQAFASPYVPAVGYYALVAGSIWIAAVVFGWRFARETNNTAD